MALVLLVTAVGCRGEEPQFTKHKEALNAAQGALEAAGTATATFDLEFESIRTLARWKGTTRYQFGDPLRSETEFEPSFIFAVPGETTVAGLEVPFDLELDYRDLRRITVGDVHYYQSPVFDLPSGRSWVQVDPGWRFSDAASDVASPDFLLADPRWYLALLEVTNAPSSYGEPDTKEIDGVTTSQYHVYCYLGDEVCPYPANSTRIRRMFPGPNHFSIYVWADEQGRPREMEINLLLEDREHAAYSMTGTVTFGGFGEPVEIEAPPEGEVQVGWPDD